MSKGVMYWDDFDIQAFFDGELDQRRARKMQNVVDSSARAYRRVNELAEMERLLLRWWFEKRNLHQ